jgi:hypothetical protein
MFYKKECLVTAIYREYTSKYITTEDVRILPPKKSTFRADNGNSYNETACSSTTRSFNPTETFDRALRRSGIQRNTTHSADCPCRVWQDNFGNAMVEPPGSTGGMVVVG